MPSLPSHEDTGKLEALERFLLRLHRDGARDSHLLNSIAQLYYKKLNDSEKALVFYKKALDCSADEQERSAASFNIGCVYMSLGRYAEAVACFDQSLGTRGVGKARWNKCLALLHNGDWLEGMRLYAARCDMTSCDAVVPLKLPIPFAADLDSLRGKRVLVVNEQGFGDEILFSRALPIVLKVSEALFVKCSPSLRKLFQASMPAVQFFDEHSLDIIAATRIDCWTNTGDLFAMACTNETPFPPVHELSAPTVKELPSQGRQTAKIGVCWACNPKSENYAKRSLTLEDIDFLSGVSSAEFYSFQTDGVPVPGWMVDLSAELVAFDDTAAYLKQMDFVITIDSVIAHLAGAMRRPGMLVHGAFLDWRWKYRSNGDFSRLYPTMMVAGLEELKIRAARGFDKDFAGCCLRNPQP